jgi:hypothetical protein
MPEVLLSEKEIREMVKELQSIEGKITEQIRKRSEKINAEEDMKPIYRLERKFLRRTLIGVQTALLNLEALLYQMI